MAESSSHNTSSTKITPKEEPVTFDKPESPNPFLPATQIEFTFKEIASPPIMKLHFYIPHTLTKNTLRMCQTSFPNPYKGENGAKGTPQKVVPTPRYVANGQNHSCLDDPIIVRDESKEEEADKEDTHDTSHDMPKDTSIPPPPSRKLAQIQELIAQARTLYLDVNQLTTLLVTSLKLELSKLLASHNFSICLPTEQKELPLKFTELFREIKELKQHVKDMEIQLLGDFKEIPTNWRPLTSTISSLTSVAELKKHSTGTSSRP
ncbi:hypothetical protein Tco_0241071 [Tanacetum coccineum]